MGGKLELHWGPTLFHLDDLPFREGLTDMPDVFTPFKQKVGGGQAGGWPGACGHPLGGWVGGWVAALSHAPAGSVAPCSS